jgi:hypothetical protein
LCRIVFLEGCITGWYSWILPSSIRSYIKFGAAIESFCITYSLIVLFSAHL